MRAALGALLLTLVAGDVQAADKQTRAADHFVRSLDVCLAASTVKELGVAASRAGAQTTPNPIFDGFGAKNLPKAWIWDRDRLVFFYGDDPTTNPLGPGLSSIRMDCRVVAPEGDPKRLPSVIGDWLVQKGYVADKPMLHDPKSYSGMTDQTSYCRADRPGFRVDVMSEAESGSGIGVIAAVLTGVSPCGGSPPGPFRKQEKQVWVPASAGMS